jgi:CRISPR-associated protein Cmr4
MYKKGYGIIETQAPLHVGASAGEEAGNLNLIFRDQFTQTGIIPGSSIRGRFRADMREKYFEDENSGKKIVDLWFGGETDDKKNEDSSLDNNDIVDQQKKNKSITEALLKFEYASIVWIPVFCPGQPVVMVSCPMLLERYHHITRQKNSFNVKRYMHCGITVEKLFFNLGFIQLGQQAKTELDIYTKCAGSMKSKCGFVVVDDNDISMIHDMALYRQSRVKLKDEEKVVAGTAFFNVEALPEKTILAFPMALRRAENSTSNTGDVSKQMYQWQDYLKAAKWNETSNTATDLSKPAQELYFGGLESIGFGRSQVNLHLEKSSEV